MEAIVLLRDGQFVREYPLDRPLQVGSAEDCDIVVDDPGAAPRALLIDRRAGTAVAYASGRGGKLVAHPLALGYAIAVGARHELVRLTRPRGGGPTATTASDGAERTQRLENVGSMLGPWVVLVGHGADARRRSLAGRPLAVGSAQSNDIVLVDATVSAHHCRFEPADDHVGLRDLGSSNGTWVGGLRVQHARLVAPAAVRIGRTELRVTWSCPPDDTNDAGFVANAPAMRQLLADVERFASLSWPVLCQAETGAGKEHVAQLLHRTGARAKGPFVALNASTFTREIIESELFGHAKGAFTGATTGHRGVFEQASGGTLFLDEIGELPLELQARLLRVLETGQVRPVGSERTIDVDVRVVSATHRDLERMAREGSFRADLYYRLTRLVTTIPPLRDRRDDIPALARQFLAQLERDVGPRRLSASAIARLVDHDWPGNVRELRNVVSRAAVTVGGGVIDEPDVSLAIGGRSGDGISRIDALLAAHGGNLSAVARTLGVSRTTLRDRLRRQQRTERR